MAVEIMEGYVQISERGLSKVQRGIIGLGDIFRGLGSGPIARMGSAVSGLGPMLSGVGAVGVGAMAAIAVGAAGVAIAIKGIGDSTIPVAAKFETIRIQFESMLNGSKDAAGRLLMQLREFAKFTPFSNDEVLVSARALLGVGTSAAEIAPTLNVLGNIASRTGASLQHLVQIYAQARAEGRAFTKDIRQFTNSGIDIIPRLMQGLGETNLDQFWKKVEGGAISFGMLQKALQGISDDSDNVMQKRSEAINGLLEERSSIFEEIKQKVGDAYIVGFKLHEVYSAINQQLQWVSNNITRWLSPLIPHMQAFTNSAMAAGRGITDWVVNALQGLVPTFQSVGRLAAAVFGAVGQALYNATAPVRGLIMGLTEFDGIFSTLGTVASDVLNPIAFGFEATYAALSKLQPIADAVFGTFYAVGELVVSVFNAIWEVVQEIGSWLVYSGDVISGYLSPSVSSLANMWISANVGVFDFVTAVVDGLRIVIDNIDLMLPIAVERFRLFGVNAFEAVRVFFVNTGRWTVWMFNNWDGVLRDILNLAKTTFSNLIDNFMSLWNAFWSWMDGGEFDFSWKPLTDGFKSEIEQWPELMDAQFQDSSGYLEELYGELDRRESDRANKRFRPVTGNQIAGPLGIAAMQIMGDPSAPAAKEKSKAVGSADLSAKSYGSAQAFSAIMGNMNRKTDTTEKAMLKVQQAQLEQMKKTNEHLSAGGTSQVEIVPGVA